ncbi:MAG: ROK family protein [Candidatus Omnitrophica bacterium]|nr:ROK family protein [Candidatus Omnitrophota bacterium]
MTHARRFDMAGWTVGVDFGGTNIKIGRVTEHGTVAGKVTLSTRDHATPLKFVDGLERAIQRLAAQPGVTRNRLRGVGVGAPGLVDGERGAIHRLVNVPGGWRRVPLRRLLEQRLHCPCAVDNDVNVVALGEWRFGAGRGTRHSVYLTLGTGVGGGLVVNGSLVRGATGSAGEIGHMVIRPDGPPCMCGARGCLEALVGTTAILRRAKRAIRQGSRRLARLAAQHDGVLSPELVCQAACAGDRAAIRLWQEIGEELGIGLSNMINLLNPERIIIGGGVAKAWPYFAPRLMTTIHRCAFEVPAAAVNIVRTRLGDEAGIVGGAVLVWEQERNGEC